MKEWLTIEERLNANSEYLEIKNLLLELRKKRKYYKSIKCYDRVEILNIEICDKQKRREKLYRFINNSRKSKYGGLYGINGDIYQMFGKLRKELTKEELREYMRIKKSESRKRLGRN